MTLEAARCQNGHVTYPGHQRCPTCGEPQIESLDLAGETAEIITWTNSTATPPGVREPNPIAIVEFTIEDTTVRAIGQLTTEAVEIGDTVRPTPVEELRTPDAGIREPTSQKWDGYRFTPTSESG